MMREREKRGSVIVRERRRGSVSMRERERECECERVRWESIKKFKI